MDYKQIISNSIYKAVLVFTTSFEKDIDFIRNAIEIPKDLKLGDFAFPCFILSKFLGLPPNQIGTKLKEFIINENRLASDDGINSDVIKNIEVVGPYLNFFVNQSFFSSELINQILSGEYTKKRIIANPKKVMVEYSQPNTHKAFHVGHTRSASLGDSIARIIEWSGENVIRSNYLGDEGTHVAKCLWYFKTKYKGEIPANNRGEFLGVLYAKAVNEFDLSLLSKAPVPGVIVSKVIEIIDFPEDSSLKIVKLQIPQKIVNVVCGGEGFKLNDFVPYAPIGTKINGRTVEIIEKKGFTSEGMICSEAEIEISDNKNLIPVLPQYIQIGEQIANVFAFESKEDHLYDVISIMKLKEKEVSKFLSDLESYEDNDIKRLWKETKNWCMEELYENYKFLDCKFDHYFFESQFGESSKKLVRKFLEKGIFVESRGAIGADLSSYGLGFCLLIKSDGNAMYACRDLELARKKFEEFGIEKSIYVVDSGQEYHFKQVFKCLDIMGFKSAKDCVHVSFAQVVLPTGKMSSRKGNVILFSELQSTIINKIETEYLSKYTGDWSKEEITDTAKKIAKATIRYGMLNQDNNSQVVFNLAEWTSRTGNTGPYILYACARMNSILKEFSESGEKRDYSLLKEETELNMIQHLSIFHNSIERSFEKYAPNVICAYVYELAKKFHKMYHECPVLHAENEELKVSRIGLIQAVKEVLLCAFSLIGIEEVERM